MACALRARGHRNVVACREGGALRERARALGFETLALPFLSEWDPLSAWRLRRALRGAREPILHAHTAHAAGLAALAALGSATRVVSHRRVDFPLSGRLSARLKYGRAGRVVAVSAAIKDILARSGLDSGRIALIPDAIAATPEERAWLGGLLPAFSPPQPGEKARLRRSFSREFDIPAEKTWIGNLAALVPHKDHDTLLAAALLLAARNPAACFLIAGEGPEQGRLLRQVRNMNLQERVFFLGQRQDTAEFLKALDIFVLSSWGEGMGSVLLEASACRLPIAATSAGGIPEILEDGRSGLLCPPRDPEALARNILRLMEGPALGASLAAEAERRLQHFGLSRMAERMEEVYAAA